LVEENLDEAWSLKGDENEDFAVLVEKNLDEAWSLKGDENEDFAVLVEENAYIRTYLP
jgi:hypothetical protein